MAHTQPAHVAIRSKRPRYPSSKPKPIDHSTDVCKDITSLYGKERYSDVTLIVGGVKFNAHKVILATRCDYFRALFYGGLSESSSSTIYLNDIDPKGFRNILHYIYTGRVFVKHLKTTLSVLNLANLYNFTSLISSLSQQLKYMLNVKNVFLIYDIAIAYSLKELVNACLRLLDSFAPVPLILPQFYRLSHAAIQCLLERSSFYAPEINIFYAIERYIRIIGVRHHKMQPTFHEDFLDLNPHLAKYELRNSDSDSANSPQSCSCPSFDTASRTSELILRSCLRLELISPHDLLTVVRWSKLLTPDQLLDAICKQLKTKADKLPHRGWLVPDLNLAVKRYGCELVYGDSGSYPYFFGHDDHDNANNSTTSNNHRHHHHHEHHHHHHYQRASSIVDQTISSGYRSSASTNLYNRVVPFNPSQQMTSDQHRPAGVDLAVVDLATTSTPPNWLFEEEYNDDFGPPPTGRTVIGGGSSYSSSNNWWHRGLTGSSAVGIQGHRGGASSLHSVNINNNQRRGTDINPTGSHTMALLLQEMVAHAPTASSDLNWQPRYNPPPLTAPSVVDNEHRSPAPLQSTTNSRSVSPRAVVQLPPLEEPFSTAQAEDSDSSVTSTVESSSSSDDEDVKAILAKDGIAANDDIELPLVDFDVLLLRRRRSPVYHFNPRSTSTSTPHLPTPHSELDVVRHSLDASNGQPSSIIVRLGKPSFINTIWMQLWDREVRSYSYYIDVALDTDDGNNYAVRDWHRVIDHGNKACRSWQLLHFPSQVVQLIRITGTHNTANRNFHLITFQCLFTESEFRVTDDGFLIPSSNVATVEHGATVLEGVSRNRNTLIDGNARIYDWNSGYTCHQMGNGAIVVQLAQPFYVQSLRFLLWDLDSRWYGYCVYVSIDQDNWTLVRDASREPCRSWQIITFPPQLVTFIRIVGMYNTANDVFHLVHLECPYPPAEHRDQGATDEGQNETATTSRDQSTNLLSSTSTAAINPAANNPSRILHHHLPSTSGDSFQSNTINDIDSRLATNHSFSQVDAREEEEYVSVGEVEQQHQRENDDVNSSDSSNQVDGDVTTQPELGPSAPHVTIDRDPHNNVGSGGSSQDNATRQSSRCSSPQLSSMTSNSLLSEEERFTSSNQQQTPSLNADTSYEAERRRSSTLVVNDLRVSNLPTATATSTTTTTTTDSSNNNHQGVRHSSNRRSRRRKRRLRYRRRSYHDAAQYCRFTISPVSSSSSRSNNSIDSSLQHLPPTSAVTRHNDYRQARVPSPRAVPSTSRNPVANATGTLIGHRHRQPLRRSRSLPGRLSSLIM